MREDEALSGEIRSQVDSWIANRVASSGWRGVLHRGEDIAVSVALACMTIIPLAEVALRKLFHTGISGSTSLVQHLTLIIGMLGAAIAARERRLISLSTVTHFLKGWWKSSANLFSGSFAAAITFFLCVASLQFVLSEREAGKILAYGIPVWTVQLFLPLGFAAIFVRMMLNIPGGWKGLAIAILLVAAVVWVGIRPPVAVGHLVIPALCILLLAAVFGAPIYAMMGGAALILFWGASQPIASISLDHYSMVTNPSLPTIPLFTLAGFFLAEGGASKRLLRVFQAFVGWLRGGPAIVTALVCAFFTSFTGASGVTILALGGVLMPVLMAARYSERASLGLLTGAGSLGLLFPPCLPLILYAIIAKIPIKTVFLGGILPGILMVAMTAWWGVRQVPQGAARKAFDAREAWNSLRGAKWELLIPVVAFAGLFGGFATPVEASAVTALYAFIVETFVYRDLRLFRDVPRVMTECGLLVGGVLLILGVALGFTNYLIDAEVPTHGAEWISGAVHSPLVFLLLLNLFLLVAGGVMEIYAAIVVVVPLIVPISEAFHIDPIHLGIIFLANMELGFLMPPAGLNLLISSYRFNKPMPEVCRAILPILAIQSVGVLLITYIPPLSTWLPSLFK